MYLLPASNLVWITALTKEYSAPLLEQLVSKGYSVSAANPSGAITSHVDGSISSIIGLNLYSTNESGPPKISQILSDVQDCLANIKAYYYSIVVLQVDGYGHHISWSLGNIFFKPNNIGPDKPTKDRSHLRLIRKEDNRPNNHDKQNPL